MQAIADGEKEPQSKKKHENQLHEKNGKWSGKLIKQWVSGGNKK